MIIFKGKSRRESFGDIVLPLVCFELSERRSLIHEIFAQWLQHFSKLKLPGKVLLIFDGAKYHLSVDIVIEASSMKSRCFVFHLTQSMSFRL